MQLTLGERIKNIDAAKGKKAKLELLRKYDCKHLREIFRLNFDDSVKFLLPKGPVPFKPLAVPNNMPEVSESSLWTELRQMYLFVEGGHKTLKQPKRENLFIHLLEGLHPLEAEILIRLKDKKLKCGLTKDMLLEAYPGLLPEVKKSETDQT